MRARIIKVDGSTEAADIPRADGNRIYYMQKLLDCVTADRITIIKNGPGRPGLSMWVDYDGLYSKPSNPTAVLMANAIGDEPITQYITGDVLLTGGIDSEGDLLGLTKIQDSVLAEFIPSVAAGAKGYVPFSQRR